MPNGVIGLLRKAVPTNTDTYENFCQTYDDLKLPPSQMRRLFERQKRDVLYMNELYQVAIDKNPDHGFPGMVIWHLSIKRLDKDVLVDWRDLQAIKNQLCGADIEAVQLFPSEHRLVDTSNQYHLWCFMKLGGKRAPKIPVGWQSRSTTDVPGGNARQEPGVANTLRAAVRDPMGIEKLETTDDAQEEPQVRER